jgi:toxin HigB-1
MGATITSSSDGFHPSPESLPRFFEKGSKAGIQPHHAARLARQLQKLDAARDPADMNLPGWKLRALSGERWSVWVNGNWRLTFAFDGEDAVLVDYEDYH